MVRWDRLGTLFTDPSKLLRDVYGWGTPTFQGNALVANIGRVVEFIAADVKARALPRLAEEQFAGRAVPEADTDPAAQYFVSLDKGVGIESFDVGLSLFPMRASTPGGTDGGIGIAPYLFGTTDTTFEVSDTLSLVLSGSQQLQGGVAVLLRAGKDPQVITGLLDELQSGTAPAEFSLMLRAAAPAGERYTILSAPDLTIDAAALSAGGGLTIGSDIDPTLTAKVDDARILVKPQSPDSFIASLLPADGITANANLEVSWSNRGGLRFKGDAGLNTTLAINKRIGPLRVDSATLALKAASDRIEGSVGVAGGAQIGPVSASLSGVGANVALKFARGNLGPVDLGATFRPPNGIGLAVDAKGVLTGGGFLFHDEAQGLYAGAMQLSLNEKITLKAFGLIATRMPDGSRGYSMIVFITAEDFRPIPLIMGMTLLGIGGMVGIHRTFDENVLGQGLKSGTLATLLFPRDPVGNAPTLIQNLARAFPARRGSYLLGLLAKIGWPTPALVTLDLALILEFGARQRLLALGRISALLPSADNDLVRLNMEAMGVLDFDEGTAAIDAVLVDSRLAQKFPITGSAALRAGFGTGPSFVLSVGGFNPHFAAPSTVPALQRVAIALSSGSNPRLVCDAYLAITSNTLQFGANASLYAAAAGFSVEGDVGFDVLIQMVPLHFLAEFHARMQLKRGSHNLFGVSLNGALEGPRPLRVSGKATFSILWCDFSVHFDTTLVKGERPPLPPAVNVLAQLTQALAAPTSWNTERSATQTHGVALRSLPPASATAPIVLDPLGQVAVRQQVVPLNTARDIDLFGGAPVAGARRFGVTATLSGTPLTNAPLRGDFAPAQFFAMTDDEKLAAPSFESMDAGCVFGDANVAFDGTLVIPAPLEYQIDPNHLGRTRIDVVSGRRAGRERSCPDSFHVERGAIADACSERRRRPRARSARRSRALPQRRRRTGRCLCRAAVGNRAEGRRSGRHRRFRRAHVERVPERADHAQPRRRALADRARSRARTLRDAHARTAISQFEFPAVGTAGRRHRDRHDRHARPETSRGRRRLDHAQHQRHAPLPAVPVRLRGPADVVGIDVHQVVRTDPRPGTADFEPNCFPSIEFDRADFPWLFTPARANANGQLRPWLCLVVIAQARRRAAHEHGRLAAADPADRGAGEAVHRAARSQGVLGLGALAGRGGHEQQSQRGERCAERRARAVALAARVPEAPRRQHRVHRVRRSDVRARTQGRPWPGDRRCRSHRDECDDDGVDLDGHRPRAGAVAGLLLVGVPHQSGRRFRSPRAALEDCVAVGLGTAQRRHQQSGVRIAGGLSAAADRHHREGRRRVDAAQRHREPGALVRSVRGALRAGSRERGQSTRSE